MVEISIRRRKQASTIFGKSNSAINIDVRDGLMPPPIRVGDHAQGWPAHELDAILRARIAGKTKEQIRELVRRLIAERATLAPFMHDIPPDAESPAPRPSRRDALVAANKARRAKFEERQQSGRRTERTKRPGSHPKRRKTAQGAAQGAA